MSSNKFISQGITIVTEAIRLDNAQEYESAYAKYKSSLKYFMMGLKHEPNRKNISFRFSLHFGHIDDLILLLCWLPKIRIGQGNNTEAGYRLHGSR